VAAPASWHVAKHLGLAGDGVLERPRLERYDKIIVHRAEAILQVANMSRKNSYSAS
jgi:hypothetical protein